MRVSTVIFIVALLPLFGCDDDHDGKKKQAMNSQPEENSDNKPSRKTSGSLDQCLGELPLRPLTLSDSDVDDNHTEIVTIEVDGNETRTTVIQTSIRSSHFTYLEDVEFDVDETVNSNSYTDATVTNTSYDFIGNYTISGDSGVLISAAILVNQSNGVSLVDSFQGTYECPDDSPRFLSEADYRDILKITGVP